MNSSQKIKLNCRWNFWRNWNVHVVLLERSWWAEFNGIYLARFGSRMWEILIFKWFLPLKIQINSPKNQVLEGKISWGRGNTWANGTGHTSNVTKEWATLWCWRAADTLQTQDTYYRTFSKRGWFCTELTKESNKWYNNLALCLTEAHWSIQALNPLPILSRAGHL